MKRQRCPTVELFVEMRSWDERGRVVARVRRRGHSYVIGMVKLLAMQVSQVAKSIKATDDTTASIGANALHFDCNGGAGTVIGVRLGTNGTAPTINDNKLLAAIAQGVAAGQLDHRANSVDADVSVVTGSAFYQVSRNFTNSSGGEITVREMGLYSNGSTKTFLFVRDAPFNIAVPNGGGVFARYTLRFNVA